MLTVTYDEIGNRRISLIHETVVVVQKRTSGGFVVTLADTRIEVPRDQAELAWTRGSGRVEFVMAAVHNHEGRRIPVCIFRFKRTEGYDDWASLRRPSITAWLTLVVPLNLHDEPWVLHSCALSGHPQELRDYFGANFWDYRPERSAPKRRRRTRTRKTDIGMLLLLPLLVVALIPLGILGGILLGLMFTCVAIASAAILLLDRIRKRFRNGW